MTSENPYAPPKDLGAGLPDAPAPFGWKLNGKTVWAEKTAQFPMVDPYSGTSQETMFLHRIKVRYRPFWLGIILPGIVLWMVALNVFKDSSILGGVLFGLLLGWMISKMAGLFFPTCRLQLFFDKRTLKRQTWLNALIGLGMASFIAGSMLSFSWMGISGIFCFLAGVILQSRYDNRLRCRRKKDGIFTITGFHANALAVFEAHQAANERQFTRTLKIPPLKAGRISERKR